MADLYAHARACLDLLDQANGYPPCTTETGTRTREELMVEAQALMSDLSLIAWGLAGCLGALEAEHGVDCAAIRKHMGLPQQPWRKYFSASRAVRRMVDDGCQPDPLMDMDALLCIFSETMNGAALTSEKRMAIWEAARGGRWTVTKVREAVSLLVRSDTEALARREEIRAARLAAARRRDTLESARNRVEEPSPAAPVASPPESDPG